MMILLVLKFLLELKNTKQDKKAIDNQSIKPLCYESILSFIGSVIIQSF